MRAILPALKGYEYRAFGFPIFSEMALPELESASVPGDRGEPVYIGYEDLSPHLKELNAGRYTAAVREASILIKIEETALFRISGGDRITFFPFPGADISKIRLFVLGTCMAALLYQRRILPLHGSAIAVNGRAYAFVGNCGAGKSTLAAAFLQQGFHMVSDDVIGVPSGFTSPSDGGPPYAIPAYPQQKLWSESMSHFGMEQSGYRQLFREGAKFAIPVAARFQTEPLPLAGVFELVAADGTDIEIRPFTKLERIDALTRHTYRSFLAPLLGLDQWHFDTVTALAGKVSVYRIRRPAEGFTAHQLAGQILQLIGKGES